MSGYSLFRQVIIRTCITTSNKTTGIYMSNLVCRIPTRGYAKKVATKGKKSMTKDVQKGPEVCKDYVRLTTHAVGANILKLGEDPKLKPEAEYPEWLFQLHLGPPKKLTELEPDTWEYVKVLRKEHMWRFNRLNKGKKF